MPAGGRLMVHPRRLCNMARPGHRREGVRPGGGGAYPEAASDVPHCPCAVPTGTPCSARPQWSAFRDRVENVHPKATSFTRRGSLCLNSASPFFHSKRGGSGT